MIPPAWSSPRPGRRSLPNGSAPLTLIVPHANILKALEITRLEDQIVIRPTLAGPALEARVVMGAVKNKKLKRAKMAERRALRKRAPKSTPRQPAK